VPFNFTPKERGDEFDVKTKVIVSQKILSNRRPIVAKEIFTETVCKQSVSQIFVAKRAHRGQCHIRVTRHQRLVHEFLCERMRPIQPVGPPTDDDKTIERWSKCLDHMGEFLVVALESHCGRFPSIGLSTRR
jgi:hypothetical protein